MIKLVVVHSAFHYTERQRERETQNSLRSCLDIFYIRKQDTFIPQGHVF